jgi:prophage antirepressor-like protein
VGEMNEIANVFLYDGNQLRTYVKDGEPWFLASDVCDVLEIKNSRDAVSRLDDDEKDAVGIPDTIGRIQNSTIVNESGLYSLIFTSRKEEAKKFKKWVTNEVLPSIRKTGQYVKPLTEREQLIASMKLTIETSEKVEQIESKVNSLEAKVDNQITLDHGEQRRVQIAIASRIYELENNKELRPPLFAELYREIRNRFGVTSYKDIKRKDMQSALHYIEAWVPRRVS